jgi:hypothetical protein
MKLNNSCSFLEAATIAHVGPVVLGLTVDASRMIEALMTPDDIGGIIRAGSGNLHRTISGISA